MEKEGGVRRYQEPCYERSCVYAKMIEQQAEGVTKVSFCNQITKLF